MKKEVVVISAKYGTAGVWDSWEGPVSGDEVFNFLMADAGMQWVNWFDNWCDKYGPLACNLVNVLEKIGVKGEYQIPGDLNIWYLGCNEKFGSIQYKDKEWAWNFCESNFDRVREAIIYMHQDLFFTSRQFLKLMKACNEGELIDNAYQIGNYLQTKNKFWKKWKKPEDFRPESSKFFGTVKSAFQEKGYKITNFGNEEVVHK